jgi:hypothetical protein
LALEERPRVRGAQLLLEVAALEVELLRLGRGRRDRDLAGFARAGGRHDAKRAGRSQNGSGSLHASLQDSLPGGYVRRAESGMSAC